MKKLAVQKNGFIIKSIQNPSEEVQKLAVQEDGSVIKLIKNLLNDPPLAESNCSDYVGNVTFNIIDKQVTRSCTYKSICNWKSLPQKAKIIIESFENKIKIIRYVDSNTLKIITEDSRPYFIKYNYLHVFDDTEFYDLPAHIGVQPAKKLVVDYFKIKSSWNQSRETINSNDDLFKHIIFMAPPGREEHEVRKKYLMVASYIDGEPLPEYTSRIKLTKLLEEKFGISDIDIEHEKREVVDYSRNLYDDFSGVSFVYVDAQYIHSKHNPWYKMDFMKYLRIMLGIKW